MLKRALSRLPAVRTIGMVDGLRHLGTSTNCWGINKIMRQTGTHFSSCWRRELTRSGTRPLVATDPERTDKTYLRNVHHIWAALASAIAFSRVKTLRAIETRFVYSMNGLFLESIANVGKPAVLRSVAPVLKGLTKLELSIRGRTYSLNGSTNQKALKTSQKYLQDFVRRLHGLKELDLSFDSSGQSGTIFNIFASGLRLEQLTTVKLHSLNVNDVAFANSIEGMIAVRDLHLLWVNITKGTWIPILKAIKTLPKLHHLHLMYSQEKGRKVFFLAQEDAPEENESMPDGDLDEDEEEDYEDYDEEDGTDTTDTDEADGTNATEVHLNEHSHHDLEDETGYYFCLKGKEIREKIPTFIAEYSVGGLARDPLSGFAFALPIPLGFTIPQTLGAGVIGPVAATGNTGGAGNGVGSATAVVSSTAAVAGAIGGGDNYDSDDDVPDLVEEFE